MADAIDEVIEGVARRRRRPGGAGAPRRRDGQTAEEFSEGFKSELNDKIVPALEDLQAALRKKDVQGVQAAAEKLQSLETSKSDKAARELGATACVG